MNASSLTRTLAFFSVGLGLAELLAPRKLSRLIGLQDDHDNLLRLLGARELASGLGIMQGKPSTFLWSRVAGDAIDLALLASAANDERNDRRRLQYAIGAVAAVTVLDVIASTLHSRDLEEPGWRIREPRNYESGLQPESPERMRSSADEAMRDHQSGHLRTPQPPLSMSSAAQPLGPDVAEE